MRSRSPSASGGAKPAATGLLFLGRTTLSGCTQKATRAATFIPTQSTSRTTSFDPANNAFTRKRHSSELDDEGRKHVGGQHVALGGSFFGFEVALLLRTGRHEARFGKT
jgi:hypothetical protein